MTEFAKYLKEQMEKHSLLIEDVSEMYDASLPCVKRWLEGKTRPSNAVINAIKRDFDKLDRNGSLTALDCKSSPLNK